MYLPAPSNSVSICVSVTLARGITNLICNLSVGKELISVSIVRSFTILEYFVLPKNIKDEIWDYCRLNDITDLNGFITKMVTNGFTAEKFGSTPWKQEIEIKEVEKIVEVVKGDDDRSLGDLLSAAFKKLFKIK